MQPLFGSILVTSWMTFEMLATDLWIAAVNARPKTLAWNVVIPPTTAKKVPNTHERKKPDSIQQKVNSGAKKKGGELKDAPQFKQQAPTISFDSLAGHGFNISEEVGQFLKDDRRVNFDSLRGIRIAYYDAFRTPGDDSQRTSQPLVDLFEKHFDDLKSLEAIRNLIAHRGGTVDPKFLAEVEEHDKQLAQLPEKEPLEADGDFVLKYMKAVDSACVELFGFVDNWLAKRRT